MKTKPCSKCQLTNDNPSQRYCKKCHAEYMRLWRLKEKERKELSNKIVANFVDATLGGTKIEITVRDFNKAKKIMSKNRVPFTNRICTPSPALLKGLSKQEKTNVLINLNSPYFMVEEVR